MAERAVSGCARVGAGPAGHPVGSGQAESLTREAAGMVVQDQLEFPLPWYREPRCRANDALRTTALWGFLVDEVQVGLGHLAQAPHDSAALSICAEEVARYSGRARGRARGHLELRMSGERPVATARCCRHGGGSDHSDEPGEEDPPHSTIILRRAGGEKRFSAL